MGAVSLFVFMTGSLIALVHGWFCYLYANFGVIPALVLIVCYLIAHVLYMRIAATSVVVPRRVTAPVISDYMSQVIRLVDDISLEPDGAFPTGFRVGVKLGMDVREKLGCPQFSEANRLCVCDRVNQAINDYLVKHKDTRHAHRRVMFHAAVAAAFVPTRHEVACRQGLVHPDYVQRVVNLRPQDVIVRRPGFLNAVGSVFGLGTTTVVVSDDPLKHLGFTY